MESSHFAYYVEGVNEHDIRKLCSLGIHLMVGMEVVESAVDLRPNT